MKKEKIETAVNRWVQFKHVAIVKKKHNTPRQGNMGCLRLKSRHTLTLTELKFTHLKEGGKFHIMDFFFKEVNLNPVECENEYV